jgi:hypothetical protein
MEMPGFVEPTDEEIALAAYRLWLQEGCPQGRDKLHWQRAREQLRATQQHREQAVASEQALSKPCQ